MHESLTRRKRGVGRHVGSYPASLPHFAKLACLALTNPCVRKVWVLKFRVNAGPTSYETNETHQNTHYYKYLSIPTKKY